MNFSKTKYVEFTRCPKAAWLTAHKPEVKHTEASLQAMEDGRKVGELAKGYFGEYEDMTTYKPDGTLDLSAMVAKTQKAIAEGVENICEAAFSFDGNYCAVDILHKSKLREVEGYEIYEVKSTSEMKEHYYFDIGYQEYVLRSCGVRVLDSRVIYINNQYVKQGEIDIHKLFVLNDKSKIPIKYLMRGTVVPILLQEAESTLKSDEFDCIGKRCGNMCDNWCGYWEYCSRNLPKPSVVDIYNFRKKWDCYEKGIVSFEDVLQSGEELTEVQRRQIDFELNKKGTYVDKEKIKSFLNELSYPLYFLDFETMRFTIPEFDGTKPYEQIPFQYSLHYVESEEGEVKHGEFLAESGVDPRRKVAESLVENIPQNVCILAYHASTERKIIENLANLFTDLSAKLLNISENILDMLPVFQKGYYYNRQMGGSFSIKNVLPAVFPEMNYKNLDGVQNGTEAMNIFPQIKNMLPEEAERTRQQLLKYCELDTFALVKLWQELLRVSK